MEFTPAMTSQYEFLIYECQQPDCRLRFPAPGKGITPLFCPFCGSPILNSGTPFVNQKPPASIPYPPGPALAIALDNLRSAHNVGAILRTADAVAVHQIFLYGITPTPENHKVEKTSLSAEFAIPWSHYPNGPLHLQSVKSHFQIWALEGGQPSVSLFQKKVPKDERPILLIMGSEVAGIDPLLLELADHRFYIPMLGFKRSLNVASAFSIAAYTIRFSLQQRE
jgi:tRNA G18 (ribose-2'-O)-methylase SpoU